MSTGEDPKLVTWQKADKPLIALPPPDMPLVGWRDPYIFEVGDGTRPWKMLMGSGLKGQGGAVMIYRADTLLGGELL
jgi:beta-fructofuranosidase